MTFTAKQIADALGKPRQWAQWHLREVDPDGTKAARGNQADAWSFERMPEKLRLRLEAEAKRQNCRSVEILLTMPRQRYKPAVSWNDACKDDKTKAHMLRDALKTWLERRNDLSLSKADLVARGLADYKATFGYSISAKFWWELFTRTIRRDNTAEDWNREEIYLPDNTQEEPAPEDVVLEAIPDDFADLDEYIRGCSNRQDPSKFERAGLWSLVCEKFDSLVSAGESEKCAGRRIRQFLFTAAKFLAPSRHALRMAFERQLVSRVAAGTVAVQDDRQSNGDVADYPRTDIKRLRWSAVFRNGCRIDAAWREEYAQLSEYTRLRHPACVKCPRALYAKVNRLHVDALFAKAQGHSKLRHLIGGVKRDATGIPSMARWVLDDWTSNIEVLMIYRDGTFSLIQPQIITVMDFASRKWIGWAMANVGAPSAELVCAAWVDAATRHGTPRSGWLENGLVFGTSLNVNGKVDEEGRTVVAGLGQFGCTIRHFRKRSPTSKGELEKSFDLIQYKMERHPGYGGRLQMKDASEDFKKQQRAVQNLISQKNWDIDAAKKHRYTYEEFERVMNKMIKEYNDTHQHKGHLKGLSPNEAFEAMRDPHIQPVKFDSRMGWLLANERYRVTVTASGVKKSDGGPLHHYGRPIQVRGDELHGRIGEEFWAIINRRDASSVTFMALDFTQTFTIPVCQVVDADEVRIATGESVLAAELKKIGGIERAVGAELRELKAEFGDVQQDLLAAIRSETNALSGPAVEEGTRSVILNSRIDKSVEKMAAQRKALDDKRGQNRGTKTKARRLGVPIEVVGDDAQARRALELRAQARRESPLVETPESTE